MSEKTFRIQVDDEGTGIVPIRRVDGSIGYQIKSMQVIPRDPTDNNTEYIVKVFSTTGNAVSDTVDFDDTSLIAVAYYSNSSTAGSGPLDVLIFDDVIFNQDIQITASGDSTATPMNVIIKVKEMQLSIVENTLTTLRNIRDIAADRL